MILGEPLIDIREPLGTEIQRPSSQYEGAILIHLQLQIPNCTGRID